MDGTKTVRKNKQPVVEPDPIPPNIQHVERCPPGTGIYQCKKCLAESSLCLLEGDLERFIEWHRNNSPKCFKQEKKK